MGTTEPPEPDALRALPSVERLLQTEPLRSAAVSGARPLAVEAARSELERCREAIRAGNGRAPQPEEIAARAAASVSRAERSSLGPVINATGVVIHTNLGRAPLPFEALEAIDNAASGYSNLEYDLESGDRGSRQAHIEPLVCELAGCEAALVVNNNAAAVLLALTALASGREVVISRGQLVEIGGSFRIPEILAVSGARLVEVGTTNRTRAADYERAIGPDTAALMRVHASNFRTVGFTQETSLSELVALGDKHGVGVIDDLGSGVPVRRTNDLGDVLRDEPAVRDSIDAGADVVCFSTDKLLGGPQGGILAGRAAAIERMRSHPLARALRIDKLSVAALEATLRLHRDPERAIRDVPVLQMLVASERELAARAERLRAEIAQAAPAGAVVRVVSAAARAGGGSLPLLELKGPAVSIASDAHGAAKMHARLRRSDPPVVARVRDDALLLDPRTLAEVEVEFVVRAVLAALGE